MASERTMKCAFILLMAFCGCCGLKTTRYYITADPQTSCGEGHEPCLTLDQFAAKNINTSATLFLIPGHHNLTTNIEVVGVDHFSVLANTSVRIQCTSPASFLFEGISKLEINNTVIVSCGGEGSSGALQISSVRQFEISNVTLQESASVCFNVKDSNGLVTGVRFVGNTGAGMNITTSTIAFERNNIFSDNLDGGIASYNSTLQFNGVNQFTKNTARGMSVISSTINCSGSMTFENNSAKRYGGGVYASDTRITIEGHIMFVGNTINQNDIDIERAGAGLFAGCNSVVDFIGTISFINNTFEANETGYCRSGGGIYVTTHSKIYIRGSSNFVSNAAESGGGVCADYNATIHISGSTTFIGNSAGWAGGSVSATVNAIGTSNFMQNSSVRCGGGVAALNAAVFISGTSDFMNNSAQLGGGVCVSDNGMLHISGNSSFTRNSASVRGGGMYVDTNSRAYFNGNSLFSDNWSMYGGGISLVQSETMLVGNTAFSNNSAYYGGAIQALEAKVNITGNGNITDNHAKANGGAVALAGGSVVYIFDLVVLNFLHNIAEYYGGAIYIEHNRIHCSYDWSIKGFFGFCDQSNENTYHCFTAEDDLQSCFDNELDSFKDKINISFSGNSALSGSAIFGEVDKLLSSIKVLTSNSPVTVGDLFHYLFNVNIEGTNTWPDISSYPNRICRCINGQPDCSDPPSPYEVSVYPGQTVGVSLVAVGHRNGTVPSITFAHYDTDDGATFGDSQNTQRIDHTTCTNLNYTVFSRRKTEIFKIYVGGLCGLEGIPLSVKVTLLECPIGFTLSNSSNQCVCEERLQKYTHSCNIDNLEITRKTTDDFWVGVDSTNGTEGLILHSHCPFDYCTTDTVYFTLVEGSNIPVTNGNSVINASMKNVTKDGVNETNAVISTSIDAQCNYNRSGLLCGKCLKGLSLVFGSSKCLKCSNNYLSLLIALALAGVILVIFLLILKLTVAIGTINGLIFYANIVSVNRAQLFPSGETNILTVFIAWVNLDLGVETCFFDGMDAYSKAWLQYAFPIYVWVLVGAIILASCYSTRIARCLGTNPVAVLATLFLLSYAKLLRSIINPLFVTFLEYPSDSKAVWLVDGNVSYLNGRHIPLFLTSLLALFLLFIPFTLLLLLGQWIQAQSERKCCSWISDYRISAFIDVYHGPFKNKHRYWCGLLLVTRICLFFVFAFNVNGDPSVNILAIAVCLIGLQAIIFQFNVYKAWYLNILEASFIINLLVLAVGTYYVDISGGKQSALTYTSVGVAFATFCGIIVYHSCHQLKGPGLKLFEKYIHAKSTESSADDSESHSPLNWADPSDPCPPLTTSFVEAPRS